MKTSEAAKIFGYAQRYVAQLARESKLRATRIGKRRWDVDPQSVESYKNGHRGGAADERTADGGRTPGQEAMAACVVPAPEPATGVTEPDPEVAGPVARLSADTITVAGEVVSMAQLFWRLSRYFRGNGIEQAKIFPMVMQALTSEESGQNGVAGVANKAALDLPDKLLELGLVHNENRYGVMGRGYSVLVATPLGTRVLRELEKKYWPRI